MTRLILPLFLRPGMTQDIFDSAVEYATRKKIQVSSYNDAAYGKLGMAKLTAEVSLGGLGVRASAT